MANETNYCPGCHIALTLGAMSCKACGWKETGAGTDEGMPTLNQLKADMRAAIARVPPDRWPERMPVEPDRAVDWFLRLVEPHHKTESPGYLPSRFKQRNTWQWPYRERIMYQLRKYLAAPQELQQLIVAAREDKIYWRGDDYPSFVCVIDETEKMRELGVADYRRKARAAMGRVNLDANR